MARLGYQRKRLRDLAAALGARHALAERERWPRERLHRYQRERLEELVRDVRERSPYWAKRLPSGRVALDRLPTIDKVEMMASFDELVTDRRACATASCSPTLSAQSATSSTWASSG